MSATKFPSAWDEARVRDVIAHYENQSEDEHFVEIEAALEAKEVTMTAAPILLAPEMCALPRHPRWRRLANAWRADDHPEAFVYKQLREPWLEVHPARPSFEKCKSCDKGRH